MSDEQHSAGDREECLKESSLGGKKSENLLPRLYDLLGTYIFACGGPYTFACGGEVFANRLLPRSIFVTDLGDLPLPLSMNDANRLQQICEYAPYANEEQTVDTEEQMVVYPDANTPEQICEHAPYANEEHTVVDTEEQKVVYPDVRRVWQLDAAKVKMDSQPWKLAASDALTSLGLLEDHIEIKLYKLLLYYRGGRFKPHQDAEKEPGMLATLIFQLPTECGHEGGTLVVQQGDEIKRFGFSRKSDSSFYHVVFYGDCEHKLQELVEGCRFCLVFNVLRKRNDIMVDKFPKNLSSVEAVLASWLEQVEKHCAVPEKLVVLLSHRYTETNLCFAGLKGRDHFVADILCKCCDDLLMDLHLCLLEKIDTYEDAHQDDEGEFSPAKWISRDDKTVEFESLNLDLLTEIVKHKDDDPLEGLQPDSTVHEDYPADDEELKTYNYYYLAALVIWPRFLSTKFVSMLSFINLIKRVEDNEENARSNLRELLGICEQYPQKIWCRKVHFWGHLEIKKAVIANRLLKICLNIGETEDVLRMIKIFAEAYTYMESISSNKIVFSIPDPSKNTYQGIFSAEVAKTLALVVKTKGWESCGSSILEKLLLENRFAIEAEQYAILALELENLGCHDFAVLVAQKIIFFLNSKGKEDFSLQVAALSAIGLLVFTLEEESMVNTFVKQSHYASTQSLCDVVMNLKDASAAISLNLKKHTSFVKLCRMLVDGDLLGPKEGKGPAPFKHVRRVMSIFFWLQNEDAPDLVVNKIVHESQTNETPLRELLRDVTFWEEAEQTDMGKAAIKKLAQECLHLLKSKPKPVFSWCQPDAKFPGYSEVEEFLRGPNETFIQMNFKSKWDANHYVQYLQGTIRNATATAGGRGCNSFCTISKTRAYFDEKVMKKWEADQEEAAGLSSLINSISGPMAKRAKIVYPNAGFIDLTSDTAANNGGLIDLTSETT